MMGQRTRNTHVNVISNAGAMGARAPSSLGILACVSAIAAVASVAPAARADEIPGTGKGIAGGALLGGEVVAITESLIGVRQGWAYALGGGLGVVGGGIGGFFIEGGTSSSTTNGQASTYLLAGGMVLMIPALVLSLNATRYHPSESATEDKPPPGIPPANPGTPGGSPITGPGSAAPAPATPSAAPATPAAGPTSSAAPVHTPAPPATSLLDLGLASTQKTGLRLGVPLPDVRPMYSMAEQKAYGLPQHAELRMPVFRVTF
jgi:hypothetical protein